MPVAAVRRGSAPASVELMAERYPNRCVHTASVTSVHTAMTVAADRSPQREATSEHLNPYALLIGQPYLYPLCPNRRVNISNHYR